MKKQMMYLFSRSPIHVGAGNSVGVVDSPIMRERHTKTPIIPGSSLKGVISGLWNDADYNRTESGVKLFGNSNSQKEEELRAGELLIGEARVLAFPVRSAKGGFAWVTSPHALQKFSRESDIYLDLKVLDGLGDTQCAAYGDVIFNNSDVILEEYKFSAATSSESVASKLSDLFEDKVWKSVENKLVIVNDEMFSYFVEHACEVVTRIGIDDETGVVKNGALFNQEQVPSETLFYTAVGTMKSVDNLKALSTKIKEVGEVIQVGGNATIGLGICSVNFGEIN